MSATTSRPLPTARLYGPPPTPPKGRTGRPRKRGDRLPSPAAMLEGRCRRVTLDIYGRSQKARVAECIARVYAAPQRPLRIVATEAIGGGRGVEVFYSTCADATAERLPDGTLRVVFDEPRFAIAPGQAVVCYDGDRVLGGGWIQSSR